MVGIRSFPIGKAYFQGRTVSFREGIPKTSNPVAFKKMALSYVFQVRNPPKMNACHECQGTISKEKDRLPNHHFSEETFFCLVGKNAASDTFFFQKLLGMVLVT